MSEDRYWQAKKVTLIGALINALLGLVKLVGGILLHSHALAADGIHSFSDLITDIMVLFASKYGSQTADDSHPYGHQRIETAATFLLATLLIVAGLGIAWDAFDELVHRQHTMPGWMALPIAILSILANELLFHYTRRVGTKINSALIIANAWHHRSDAASSIVVALGLLGTLFGFIYFDAIAAVVVGLLIVKMGLEYMWNSVKELVDTAVAPAQLAEIEKVIQRVNGVDKIHQLRSRLMGGDILIDVHIMVSPLISVSEGHYIAQHVHQVLMNEIERVKDVTVHVDPEDDETCCPSVHLPNRRKIEKDLLLGWQRQFSQIRSWVIHYLDGQILIDLFCSDTDMPESLQQTIESSLLAYPMIKHVRLLKEMTLYNKENAC